MKRGGPIKSRPKRISAVERAAREAWRDNPEPCVACRHTGLLTPGTDPHHCLYKQRLRRYVETRAYEERLGPGEVAELMAEVCFDTRNRAWLCSRHHTDHHTRKRPLPQAVLPESVWEFAAEHGFTEDIYRDYG